MLLYFFVGVKYIRINRVELYTRAMFIKKLLGLFWKLEDLYHNAFFFSKKVNCFCYMFLSLFYEIFNENMNKKKN